MNGNLLFTFPRTTIHPPQTFPDFPNQFSVNIETVDNNNRFGKFCAAMQYNYVLQAMLNSLCKFKHFLSSSSMELNYFFNNQELPLTLKIEKYSCGLMEINKAGIYYSSLVAVAKDLRGLDDLSQRGLIFLSPSRVTYSQHFYNLRQKLVSMKFSPRWE